MAQCSDVGLAIRVNEVRSITVAANSTPTITITRGPISARQGPPPLHSAIVIRNRSTVGGCSTCGTAGVDDRKGAIL